MPALLVHMTVVEGLPGRGRAVAPLLSDAAARARGALLLGSVLPDLAYHAHFPMQVARHLARMSYVPSEWGDLLHIRGTGHFGLALVAYLRRAHLSEEERRQVLALLAGYLSHYATDRVMHPLIEALVAHHRRRGEPRDVAHSRIERIQSLLYHHDLLGIYIAGAPHGREVVAEMAGAGLARTSLPPALWRAFRAACLEAHGRAPARGELASWLRGVTAYSYLVSSPAGRLDGLGGDPGELRALYYQGKDVDAPAFLERALERTVAYWRAAELALAAPLTSERRRVFLEEVPDVDLSTGV